MGRGIVYCGDCGKRLQEDDFERGQAHEIENSPYCIECRRPPEPLATPPSERKLPSSGRWKAAKRTSSRTLPVVPLSEPPPPRRRARRQDSRKLLLISGGVVGAGLVLLLVALLFGGSSGPSPSAAPAPERAGQKAVTRENHKRIFDRLAAFAGTSQSPDEILFRCDAARRKLSGTAYESRIGEIERKAREVKGKRGMQRRLEASLADVKKMMASDRTYRREEEVIRLLTSLRDVAGGRRREVERMLKTYQDRRVLGRLEEARRIRDADTGFHRENDVLDLLEAAVEVGGPHKARAEREIAEYQKHRVDGRLREARRIRAADREFKREDDVRGLLEEALELEGAPRARIKSELEDYDKALIQALRNRRIGPYPLNEEGYIRQWLVLGPFSNEDDKGYDKDFLGGETRAQPANRIPVHPAGETERAWRAVVSKGDRLEFVPIFGSRNWVVGYAACWVESDADRDVEVRVGSDDGFKAWLDGKPVGSDHTHRPCAADQHRFPVRLARGRHLLLVKVDQGDGGHEFMLRIVTPEGKKAPGIRIYN